jgi:hypothetical protein
LFSRITSSASVVWPAKAGAAQKNLDRINRINRIGKKRGAGSGGWGEKQFLLFALAV